MNTYLNELYNIEILKDHLALEPESEDTIKKLEELENRADIVREKYLKSVDASKLEALKKQEERLRNKLFDLRYRQSQLAKNPESEEYLQNSHQIKVVRREIARLKFNMRERGKQR